MVMAGYQFWSKLDKLEQGLQIEVANSSYWSIPNYLLKTLFLVLEILKYVLIILLRFKSPNKQNIIKNH